jgi:CubicO group peptidase (beta-lactamase class C family)
VPYSLPRSSPIEQQVDPAGVLGFLDALDARPDIEMHSFILVRHGRVVAEGWWHPYSADRVHLLYSLSKSFTSTAAAFAAAEGLLDLDDTIIKHFPEFAAEITDPRSRAMRIRHVAAMSSGHAQETRGEAVARDPKEPVRGFLLIPPDQDPGTVFAYNQPCTYTLASIVQRNAGMPLTGYLRPRLFEPLGIGEVGWSTLAGREQGFTGLHARTEDIAKLGQLYLQRGEWNGSRLLSSEWVAEATSKHIDTANQQQNPDWRQGYGFQFWMSRHGYRGDGAFGQFCVVLPEQDVVVATTASTRDMQAVLDALWTHVLPALDRSGADARTQDELAARLRTLALPPYQADAEPSDWAAWSSAPFDVSYVHSDMPVEPTLRSVRVQQRGAGVQLELCEAENALTLEVGTHGWCVSTPVDKLGNGVPVASAGGWSDPKTLRVEVIFLETPHRVDIECSLDKRRAQVSWRLPPLGGFRLAELHCPR